jgi:flagellin-like hook-associated protein FlgL
MGVDSNNGPRLVEAYAAARLLNQANHAVARSLAQLGTAQRAGLRDATRQSSSVLAELEMLSTADAALGEVQEALQRIHVLSIYAESGALADGARAEVQGEVDAQVQSILDVAAQAQSSGQPLLSSALGFTVGPEALGVAGLNVATRDAARSAVLVSQAALDYASVMRAKLGARQDGLARSAGYLEEPGVGAGAGTFQARALEQEEGVAYVMLAAEQVQDSLRLLAQAYLQADAVVDLLDQPPGAGAS